MLPRNNVDLQYNVNQNRSRPTWRKQLKKSPTARLKMALVKRFQQREPWIERQKTVDLYQNGTHMFPDSRTESHTARSGGDGAREGRRARSVRVCVGLPCPLPARRLWSGNEERDPSGPQLRNPLPRIKRAPLAIPIAFPLKRADREAPAVWARMAQERTLPTFYLGNYSEQSYQTWPIVTECDKARSQGQGEMSENVKILTGQFLQTL